MSLPIDIECEKKLLAGILKFPDALADVKRRIGPGTFSSEKLAFVYNTIKEFQETNPIVQISYNTLVKLLKEKHLKDEALVFQAIRQSYHFHNTIQRDEMFYCLERLNKLRKVRRALIMCEAVARESGNGMDVDNIMNHINDCHAELTMENSCITRGEYVKRLPDRLKELFMRAKNPNQFKGIPFGIPEVDSYVGGIKNEELAAMLLPSSCGKCHGKGTKILMYDGSIKNVEDIGVGEKLMGPDSKPRTVLTLGRGKEMMYAVKQQNGDTYTVNESHILSLIINAQNPKYKGYKKNQIINISVKDYLASTYTFRTLTKGYKSSVNFEKIPVHIEPYLLGLWLGDGNSRDPRITTPDIEIVEYLEQYALKYGLVITKYLQKNNKSSIYSIVSKDGKGGYGPGGNPFLNKLKFYDLLNNKHVPHDYLVNDRQTRLELLAGLLDSDGYRNPHADSFEYSTKLICLKDAIIYLARSLGFRASVHPKIVNGATYYIVLISGDTHLIPTKIKRKQANKKERSIYKNFLATGISVVPVGVDDYFGFELDSDGLYLLGDFTVTHNTCFLCNASLAAAFHCHNVLFITIESPRDHIEHRIDSTLATINHDQFRQALLTKDEAKKLIKEVGYRQNTMGKLEIVDIPDNVTPSVIQSLVREAQSKRHVGLVVIDYMNIMTSNGGTGGSVYDWKPQMQLSLELKRVARRCGVPILTAIQTNDDSKIAFARNIKDNLDYLITLEKPDNALGEMGFRKLKFLKGRELNIGKDFWIHNKFDTMTFDDGRRPTQAELDLMLAEAEEETD